MILYTFFSHFCLFACSPQRFWVGVHYDYPVRFCNIINFKFDCSIARFFILFLLSALQIANSNFRNFILFYVANSISHFRLREIFVWSVNQNALGREIILLYFLRSSLIIQSKIVCFLAKYENQRFGSCEFAQFKIQNLFWVITLRNPKFSIFM